MCESANLDEFEQRVYVLATDLQQYDVGHRLPATVHEDAQLIATTLNEHRQTVRSVFPEVINTSLLDRIAEAVKTEKSKRHYEQNPEVIRGLIALDQAFRPRYEQLERIGIWIAEILPKSPRTAIKPKRVINSLLAHPELALDDLYELDSAEATAVDTQPGIQPIAEEVVEFRTAKIEQDSQHLLPILADDLMQIVISAAKTGSMRTKINIRTNEFRDALQSRGLQDLDEKALFHDAWEFIVASFLEQDSDYQLFTDDGGSTRGRKYILNDPEIAELFWNDEDSESTDLSEVVESVPEAETKITEEQRAIQNIAYEILDEKRRNREFIGVNDISKQIADKLGLPQKTVKSAVNSYLRTFEEDKIEIFFSSRRTKRLIRLK